MITLGPLIDCIDQCQTVTDLLIFNLQKYTNLETTSLWIAIDLENKIFVFISWTIRIIIQKPPPFLWHHVNSYAQSFDQFPKLEEGNLDHSQKGSDTYR